MEQPLESSREVWNHPTEINQFLVAGRVKTGAFRKYEMLL